jgi:hypothetical protein
MKPITTFVLVTVVFLAAPVWAADPVKVYVLPEATNAAGFVDAERTRIGDTIKDVREAITKRKDMVLVSTEDQAAITLEVTHSDNVATGNTNVYFGRVQTPDMQQRVAVMMRVRHSDYQKEFSSIRGAWGTLAKFTVNQVGTWIQTNRAQLDAVKPEAK